ncbi:MAG: flagellar motor switch protein FliG [Bryobacteraceae bacterium]|jgi:flagellar motor switch protein FliG
MIVNVAQNEKLRGYQKAAVFLVTLGEESSAEILKHLSEDEVNLVTQAVARITNITADQADGILEEFYQMTLAQEFIVKGGLDYAKKMLMTAFGPETTKRLMDRLSKALGSDVASFDALQRADPQQLAKFIHNEHPQTIALVLSHLNPTQAASLLVSLPQRIRSDVAIRMANLDQISPEIIHKIASVIGQKLKTLGDFSRESYGGVRAVSEMFNRLDSGTSKDILADIEQQDTNLFETIRQLMFVFDDLLLIDSVGIKEVLSRIDRKVLTCALKGTSEQLRNHLFSAMSQRGAEMLREDIDALGPMKIREVDAAQQQIISVVRQLESEGVLSLKGAVGEQYVM